MNIRYICHELKVLIKREKLSRLIFAETVIEAILAVCLFRGENPSYFGSVYNFHYLINHHTLSLIVIVLMLFPLTGSLASGEFADEDEAVLNELIVRKKRGFWGSRFLAVFFIGFINAAYVLGLLALFEYISVPDHPEIYITDNSSMIDFAYPEYAGVLFLPLIFKIPRLFFAGYILLMSSFSGACACLSYSLAGLLPFKAAGYFGGFAFSLLLSFSIMLLSNDTQIFAYYNLFSLFSDTSRTGEVKNLLLLLAWLILLLLTSYVLHLLKGDRRQ